MLVILQETVPIEQLRHLCNEASLLASVLVEQHINQTVIVYIAFLKMVGSLLNAAFSLRDCLLHLMWEDFKNELLRQYSAIPFDSHVTKPLPIWNKVLISYLKCTFIMPLNLY